MAQERRRRIMEPQAGRALAALALGLVLAATNTGALAAAEAVDLALVLAADVSRSVDEDEFNLQRQGYANAFTRPEVLKSIQAGAHHGIAVTYVEWSGASEQQVVADWTVIRDGESGAVFASTILAPSRSFAGFTSISGAIDFALKRLAASGIEPQRRVIDISGDGTNNAGRPVTAARDEAVGMGITINGLAIINLHPNPGYFAHTQPPGGLPLYYQQNVIGGPASFLLVIEDFNSFGEAIVNKLVGEIAGTPGIGRAAAVQ